MGSGVAKATVSASSADELNNALMCLDPAELRKLKAALKESTGLHNVHYLLTGTKWEWMHDGENVNGEIEFCADGKTLQAFGTSTWTVVREGEAIVVVCANVGRAREEHRLTFNDTLTAFSCTKSGGEAATGQKGRLLSPESSSAKVTELLKGTKWQWMHDGKNINGFITLCADQTLKAFGTSTWSVLMEDDAFYVVGNIGRSAEVHRLQMNRTLTAFTCSHSGQKGKYICHA